jgi:chemotaxis protein methyltransferase CheR
MTLPLSPQVFAIMSTLIEDATGIHHPSRELLQEKVSARAEEAGFDSLLEYYYFLRYDPAGQAELAALIEHLVVQETYFFREVDQLEFLVDRLVAPLVASGRRPRIWSAACATGEEPLTIAMLLAHRGLLDAVTLVASDLSARALDVARRGSFGRRSIRTSPLPSAAGRWLTVQPGGAVQVDPTLVARISWKQVNLCRSDDVRALGTFDFIVCRNVLIYFRDATVNAVVGGLAQALAPGGLLFVGVSESLMRFGTSLTCEEQGGIFFYRRAAA